MAREHRVGADTSHENRDGFGFQRNAKKRHKRETRAQPTKPQVHAGETSQNRQGRDSRVLTLCAERLKDYYYSPRKLIPSLQWSDSLYAMTESTTSGRARSQSSAMSHS